MCCLRPGPRQLPGLSNSLNHTTHILLSWAVLTPVSLSFRNLLDKDMFSKSDPRKFCSDNNNSNTTNKGIMTDCRSQSVLEPLLSSVRPAPFHVQQGCLIFHLYCLDKKLGCWTFPGPCTYEASTQLSCLGGVICLGPEVLSSRGTGIIKSPS